MIEGERFASDDQSVFNMGVSILIRIDKILSEIAVAKLNGEFKNWYSGVFTLKGEIYYKLQDEEKKEIDTLFKELQPMITESTRKYKAGGKFNTIGLSEKLESIETKLKEFMEKRAMLGVSKRDPRYALSGGYS